MPLEPDRRWRHFSVRLGNGTITGWSEELLRSQLSEWSQAIPAGVPETVRHHLEQSRELIAYSWYRYELLPEAERNAYVAIEMHLRHVLGSRARLKELIEDAEKRGLIAEVDANRLQASREIRNELTHPPTPILVTPADAMWSVQMAHEMVSALSASGSSE